MLVLRLLTGFLTKYLIKHIFVKNLNMLRFIAEATVKYQDYTQIYGCICFSWYQNDSRSIHELDFEFQTLHKSIDFKQMNCKDKLRVVNLSQNTVLKKNLDC